MARCTEQTPAGEEEAGGALLGGGGCRWCWPELESCTV